MMIIYKPRLKDQCTDYRVKTYSSMSNNQGINSYPAG